MTLQEQLRVYWDRQPCGFLHSNLEPGSPAYFAEIDSWRYKVQPHIPRFARFCEWRGLNVLDAGCGLGSDSRRFIKAGANVLSVDGSWKALELLGYGTKRLIGFMDLDRQPFEHKVYELNGWLPSYDLIWCFGVLHHLEHPERALKTFYIISNGNTTLRLMVYNRCSWKALRVWLGIDQPEAQAGCPLARTYTKRGITKLLSENGWQVQSIQVEHIFPWKIGPYKEHRLEKLWYWDLLPDRLFHWLEHHIGWHLCVTARPI